MFRIAWNQGEHGVGADGLRKVGGLEFPSNARRCYVIITPESIWLGDDGPHGTFLGNRTALEVGSTRNVFSISLPRSNVRSSGYARNI